MTATNTIPNEEYARRLFEASRIALKKLSNLAFDEYSKSRTADNKGDNEKALRHEFIARVIGMAAAYLAKSPKEWEEIIH